MTNIGAYSAIMAAIVLIASMFLAFLYQTRIRIGSRDVGTLTKLAVALVAAAAAAWTLFLDGMAHYTIACVAIITFARAAYIFAKNRGIAQR